MDTVLVVEWCAVLFGEPLFREALFREALGTLESSPLNHREGPVNHR
jgi:hypothetical protein